VARVIYARRAIADLERLADFVADQDPDQARLVIDRIASAVEILEHHPLIGRLVERGMRELVISRRKTGYIALYDDDADDDLVVVLAIRHQREAGYR